MSESTYDTLLLALSTCPFEESRRAAALEQNVTALQRLRDVPWPDLSKLERVRLHSLKDDRQFFNAWRLPGIREPMVIVTPWFRVEQVRSSDFSKVEVLDYADELDELLRMNRKAESGDKRAFESAIFSDHYTGGSPPYAGIYHACAAAFLGKNDTAKALVHHALKYGDYFPLIYDAWAVEGFYRGTKQLEAGAPRSEVLSNWTESLKVYPHSRYREQLIDYAATLREQISQEKELISKEVDAPEKLPIEEMIAYYIARFPDVHGEQLLMPGRPITVFPGNSPRKGAGTWFSSSVVQIGRPALPTLIEHLNDRRFTRSVGANRTIVVVLRVQDVALECIEKIAGVRFYSPTSTSSYLSTESPENREKVIADIKIWWDNSKR